MVTRYWSANFENLSLKGVNCPRMDVQTVLFGGRCPRSIPLAMLTMKKASCIVFYFDTRMWFCSYKVMVLRLAAQLRSYLYKIIVARKTGRFCISSKERYLEVLK